MGRSVEGKTPQMLSTTACFLCAPLKDLIFARCDSAFALTGLGPILPGYTVVAATQHSASAADVNARDPLCAAFAEWIRRFLTRSVVLWVWWRHYKQYPVPSTP